VFCAIGILFPCVFNELEECRGHAGARMSVAMWHTPRFAGVRVRYLTSPYKPRAKDNCGPAAAGSPAKKRRLRVTGVRRFFARSEPGEGLLGNVGLCDPSSSCK
jgi:hypothetical protein